jgi:hypothetical protein
MIPNKLVEASSRWADQEIVRFLWNPKFHYCAGFEILKKRSQ